MSVASLDSLHREVGRKRNYVVAVLLLAAAASLIAKLCWPARPPVASSVRGQLLTILPDADPLLIDRVSTAWGFVALSAAKNHGEHGLHVLETFGDEAAYGLQKDPQAFASLVRLWNLDSARFRLTAGPWNRAVLDWAQNGKLGAFLDKVERMPPEQLTTADGTPAALPLLLAGNAPTAQKMLEQYGVRAWRLFMAVNFADSPASVERVADVIDRYRELPLELNDEFGLPAALMLVSPATDLRRRSLPDVVDHASHCPGIDRSLAVTLMLQNYDDVARMLNDGISVERINNSIDVLAGQPECVQMLAAETPQILRLLCERRGGQNVGFEAFRRCGPAATIAYTFYGSDPKLSQAAVVAMGGVGWPAFEVLDRFRKYGNLSTLLRRPELMNANELNPLVIDAVGNVSRTPFQLQQQKIDIYHDSKNLAGELMNDRYPPPDSETYLQWVPLYMAYRVGEKYANGLHISKEELAWAGVDVALTLTPLKGSGKVANGAKGLVKALDRGAAEVVAKQGLSKTELALAQKAVSSAERTLLQQTEKTALHVMEREGIDIGRFGPNAAKIAMKRLDARGDGIALGLADRSTEYAAAREAGDLGGKSLIAEEIGLEGMKQYAIETGRTPLFVGRPRQGAGFDGVFKDGERTVVMEAKGGSSQVKHFHGFWQGTPEYTREVARRALTRPSASEEERAAAREVLRAYDAGTLDIEVVITEHVHGKPRPTRVESPISVGGNIRGLSTDEIKGLLLRTPGATVAFVRDGAAGASRLTMEKFISRSEAMAKRAGVELWKPGAGPLMPRVVRRRGAEVTIKTFELPAGDEMTGVGEFVVAVMERSL